MAVIHEKTNLDNYKKQSKGTISIKLRMVVMRGGGKRCNQEATHRGLQRY